MEGGLSILLPRCTTGGSQLQNAGDLAGATWGGGKVSGRGKSPKICGPYAGLWSPDKWGWVDCNEGGPLIAYQGGIVICKWSGKLLPLSICGTSGPKAHTTFPGWNQWWSMHGPKLNHQWSTSLSLDRLTEWDTEEEYTEEVLGLV